MDRWVFVHIMKTAGTAFRRMLRETPGISEYPTQAELAANAREMSHAERRYLPASQLLARIGSGELDLTGRQFLCGHYSASLADSLPGTWRTVTFLRDPVRRTLSMIAHHHYRQGPLKRFVRPGVSRYLADVQADVVEHARRFEERAEVRADTIGGRHQ